MQCSVFIRLSLSYDLIPEPSLRTGDMTHRPLPETGRAEPTPACRFRGLSRTP